MNKTNEKTSKERMKKLLISIIVTTFLAILFISSVSAIGITPGKRTFDYHAGMTETVEFRVINTEYKEMTVELYKYGDLAQFIDFENEVVHFHEDEESKTFRYKFHVGDIDLAGGSYEGGIVAVEVPKGAVAGQVSASATAGVATLVVLRIPYPGKYIEARLEIGEAMPGEKVQFIIPTTNLGTQEIEVKGEIEIILGGEVIETLETNMLELKPQQRDVLKAEWLSNESGIYLARAKLKYNGKELVLEKEFRVGEDMLEIKRIFVKNYRLNEIAKVAIVVESKWNEIINNVYGHLIVTSERGDIVGNFRSASIDLAPKTTETIYAYWDTEGISEGLYDGKIILHYEDKEIEKLLRARLSIDNLEIEIIGLSAQAIASRGAIGDTTMILIIVIIILVLVNLAWFLYFKRIKRNKKPEEKETEKPKEKQEKQPG